MMAMKGSASLRALKTGFFDTERTLLCLYRSHMSRTLGVLNFIMQALKLDVARMCRVVERQPSMSAMPGRP